MNPQISVLVYRQRLIIRVSLRGPALESCTYFYSSLLSFRVKSKFMETFKHSNSSSHPIVRSPSPPKTL